MTGTSLALVGGDERRARVVWSHLVEPVVDPSRSTPGLTVTGLIARDGALRPLEGLASGSLTLAGAQARLAGLDLAAHLRALDRLGIRVLIPGDEEWPLGLDDLPTPPHCLYVRGPFHQSALHEDGLAVVGARACTPYGSQVARNMAAHLTDRGRVVISGGAFGIDAAAHEGALSAQGPTVAVLACGLDRFYPQANAGLFRRILDDGALVSELPPGCAPYRQRFLARNRLIAALGVGTVVVEASLRSGSLSTAGRAFELGRHVAMVPGPVTSAASAGCHEWLRTKPVSLVTDGRDVLDLMGQLGVDAMDPRRLRSTVLDLITDDDEALYSAVPVRDGADVTALQRASGLSAQDTTKGLGRLQALGVVEHCAGRWRKAALT